MSDMPSKLLQSGCDGRHGLAVSRLRIRKHFCSYLIWMAAISGGLLIYHKSPWPMLTTSPPKLGPTRAPLLGEGEDVTKLWFPPILLVADQNYTPQVAPHNEPVKEVAGLAPPTTPLFIAFTRNNDMLIQSVLSYIAAGWPRSEIIVVDNSGTMDANPRGLLTRANPFFLDYELLRHHYGVSILQTATYLSFAQLQNFFLRTAIAHGWPYFLWSHMDVTVLSDETAEPYRSFHDGVLDVLLELGYEGPGMLSSTPASDTGWAVKFFNSDWLTLVNVKAWRTIGAWDTFIPYYATDWDAYCRLAMHGFTKDEVRTGSIYDMAFAIEDPEMHFFPSPYSGETLNSTRYRALQRQLESISRSKRKGDRNKWQVDNGGRGRFAGKDEPWTYDPLAFDMMWWLTATHGRSIFVKKWGATGCNPYENSNVTLADEFASLFDANGTRLNDYHV